MRISDWSSDVCSSDLAAGGRLGAAALRLRRAAYRTLGKAARIGHHFPEGSRRFDRDFPDDDGQAAGHERDGDELERIERDHRMIPSAAHCTFAVPAASHPFGSRRYRTEEHTSELSH